MGRPPSNGVPAFRFTQQEVAEMETVLQGHNCAVPAREVLVALAEKFSASPERQGKIVVQMKQVWNWFQNRRYALRAKSAKTPEKLGVSPQQPIQPIVPVPSMPAMPSITQDDRTPPASVPQSLPHFSGQNVARIIPDNSPLEFEAKSARDGAWYDVGSFLAHRHWETGDPEVLVRFSGFGKEEDEWINVKRNVRPRSLPCEASECVAVLPGDLILCFQEGKEQALYYDAHVLDSQRRRHDVRGCRCRFLVRYDHDQSEEIVPLRKICRRPETDYRLQQLNAAAAVNPSPGGETTDQQKDVANLQTGRDTADQQRSDADPSKRGPNSPEMLQPSHDAAEDAGCEASQANASPVTAAGAAPGPKNEGTANAVNEAADGSAANAAMVDCSVANEQEANAVV